MLKRIYVDNFKCLVNFELNLDSKNLFLGTNGVGKSTVLYVLSKLQRFLTRNEKIVDVFPPKEKTLWQQKNIQLFELDVVSNEGLYKYVVEIEHDPNPNNGNARLRKESLHLDDKVLFSFKTEKKGNYSEGIGYLYNDYSNSETDGLPFSFNWFYSGLGNVQERHDNKKLVGFKEWLNSLQVIKINTDAISSESEKEEERLCYNTSNYFSWLRYLSQSKRRYFTKLERELSEIVSGFEIFNFEPSGYKKILELEFSNKIKYGFDGLSDGQKALIVLYTLLYCSPDNSVLCIDEPENFLALPEIQPWLDLIYDLCEENKTQVILISHHPKIINWLANKHGHWFSKQEGGYIRVQRLVAENNDTGLPISDLVERGWIYEP